MAAKSKLDNVTLAAALVETKGNISRAAARFHVSRSAIQKRVAESEKLKEVLSDARETSLDVAESSLDKAVADGEAWAVCFKLKTQGKSRGYVERQELTGAAGGPVVLSEVVVSTRQEASVLLARMKDIEEVGG